jgi:hypothetical protein
MSSIKPSPWLVCEKRDVRFWRSLPADAIDEGGKDDITDPSTLMFRQDGHIHDVKVPAAVANYAAHSNGRSASCNDVNCPPASSYGSFALTFSLRTQTGPQTERQVIGKRWWTFNQAVLAHSRQGP